MPLFLFLISLSTAVYMMGCSGSESGGNPGWSFGEESGPMSMEALEQFWLDTYGDEQEKPFIFLKRELLAKAKPDECYTGIGNPQQYPFDFENGAVCDGTPKVNEAYVWGLTKYGDHLWFGTVPNVHCLGMDVFLGPTFAHESDSWVCEGSQGNPYPYDWRPPSIYRFNTATGHLDRITSDIIPELFGTLGIRAAGTHNGVVFLGGPGKQVSGGGIDLFAFDGDTGDFLGFKKFPQYGNIRKWKVVNDALYVGVAYSFSSGKPGGAVLRWRGSKGDDLWNFEVVGEVLGEAAEVAFHEGRIFVSTWPRGENAGLWMSPVVPPEGLSSEDKDDWQKVWSVEEYEPDPVTAGTYGGGALASFDGYLYWGTMHVPFLSALAHFKFFGFPENEEEVLKAVLGTHRAISIFRGRNFGTENEEIGLLYGLARLPVYDGAHWKIEPNNMGSRPLWGLSGFGNFFNNYTWSMAVYNSQLFVGTMDWSYLLKEILDIFLEFAIGYVPEKKLRFPTHFFGADLWRFLGADFPAIPESLSGVGNYTSYGIRNMVSDDALYLGIANPWNLLTDPYDEVPEGGWELIKLTPLLVTSKEGNNEKTTRPKCSRDHARTSHFHHVGDWHRENYYSRRG